MPEELQISKFLEQIRGASYYDEAKTRHHLNQQLVFRQQIARKLLQTTDEAAYKELCEQFNYVNQQIKETLYLS